MGCRTTKKITPLGTQIVDGKGLNLFSSRRTGGGTNPYIQPTSTIPTNSLYSHWDFSLLSDADGTTYTSDNTLITGASGTSIGAASGTPQLYHRRSGTGTFSTTITTQNGKKCLSVAQSSGTFDTGAYLQSGGNAYPDISSSSVSYTWIAVWKHTTGIVGYVRPYRWYLNSSSYEFNHALWWLNSSGSTGELDAFNYSASQRFASIPASDSNRPDITIVHYEIVTITGNSYEASYNNTSGTTSTVSGTLNGTATYSTVTDANRYFEIRPVTYSNANYPALLACEYAFYNRSMDSTERGTVITNLKNKWG